jgi:hypothetical protein
MDSITPRLHHAPAALPPQKTRYPLYRRLGRPGPVWRGTKNFVLTGILSPVRPAGCEPLYRTRYPGRQCADSDKQPARQAGRHVTIYYKRMLMGQTALKNTQFCLNCFVRAQRLVSFSGKSTTCRCFKIKRAQENIRSWTNNKCGSRQADHTECFKETPQKSKSEQKGNTVPYDGRWMIHPPPIKSRSAL